VGLFAKHLTPLERVVSVMWHVPQWYLFAWVGHFGLQKDVPAVFTYGLTPKSFLSGEFCSTMWVYTGSVFESKPSALGTSDAKLPSALLFGIAVLLFAFIGAATPAGFLWQKEYRMRRQSVALAAATAKAK